MSSLVDTNCYYILFENPRPAAYANLRKHITIGGEANFFISKMTSLEIHSVLGKAYRGVPSQVIRCTRTDHGHERKRCPHLWYRPATPKVNRKALSQLRKLIDDIERAKGATKAFLLPIDDEVMKRGSEYLCKYGIRFSFGSHDAVIAATAKIALEQGKISDVITRDRGLKALLKAEGIPVYDPETDMLVI